MFKSLFFIIFIFTQLTAYEIVLSSTKVKGLVSKDIVVDATSGLMWQDDEQAEEFEASWDEANDFCQDLNLNGYKDWYLPRKKQLLSITGKEEFNHVSSYHYWSSTVDEKDKKNAWMIGFEYGGSDILEKSTEHQVRCVRDDETYVKPNISKANKLLVKDIVRDRTSGLMWQDDARAEDLEKTWEEANLFCQSLAMGGYTDWKLPSKSQLLSITDNPRFENASSYYYWSSTIDEKDENGAWMVDFNYGNTDSLEKSSEHQVRCVRQEGDILAFNEPSGINDENIFRDTTSGLLWQDDDRAESLEKTWQGAKEFCKTLSMNGNSDWTLPNKEQLLSIAGDENFENVSSYAYWSSSVDKKDPSLALTVGFGYGNTDASLKSNEKQVRCVSKDRSRLGFEAIVESIIKSRLHPIIEQNPQYSLEKDMFETQEEFQQRHNTPEFLRIMQKVKKEAVEQALKTTYGSPQLGNLTYDAENAYFVADLNFELKKDYKTQKIAISIPKKLARDFYKSKDRLQSKAVFELDDKGVRLKRVDVMYKKNTYLAQLTDKKVDTSRVEMSLTGINGLSLGKNEIQAFDSSKLKSTKDLDLLLSKAKEAVVDKTKWLFVVGIEKYEYTDNISYAKRSAEMFTKATQKVLGISKTNSYVLINTKASQAHIKTNLKKMLRRVKEGDTIYFYYNGHGVPVPSKNNEPYLLTFDTEPDFVQDENFFALQNIYSKLSDSKAKKVVAVVDSCFSGVTDGKAVLKGVAATRVIAKRASFDKEKMVVLSAGKGHQYSNAYNKKAHRLFSFYVMKNLLEGTTNVKSLYQDTKAQTYETSLEEYGDLRVQEPTVYGNMNIEL